MKQKRPLAYALALLCLALSVTAFSASQRGRGRPPGAQPARGNGCDLPFTGSDRKAVKLRPPNLDYSFLSGGRPVSVADFFTSVCPLDARVPPLRRDIPQGEPLPEEKLRVKLRAFVLAMKLETNDNDLHVQVGDRPAPFDQPQLVVEIPPGPGYCDARSVMMDLFRADGGTNLSRHIFRRPPQVELTGYLFLDAAHMRARRTDFCTDNGGRGIRQGRGASPVRGIWELHPVIKVERAEGQSAEGGNVTTSRRRRSPVFTDGGPPPGATAQCRDGAYSFSRHRRGTCSSHGGVAVWY